MPKTESRSSVDVTTLVQEHDCLLLDLDGTVFRGHEATVGAVDTLAAVTSRKLYVTNNASRASDEVAAHLRALGFSATADDVVTSAQSAASLLAERLPAGAAVLVVGTDSLAAEITNVGLKPVRQWSDDPAAVVQGHSPETALPILAEAALAIRGGALWVAAKHRIPMLIVMYNNRAYYNDWEHQIRMAKLRGTPVDRAHIGMDMSNPDPDFGKLTQSMGWYGEGPIDDPKKVAAALKRAIAKVKSGQPALLDAITQKR